MPYITPERRSDFDEELQSLIGELKSATMGDLNYVFSTILSSYINIHGLRYENINNLVGMLECAKMELYRRVGANYEDLKAKENGDVYL